MARRSRKITIGGIGGPVGTLSFGSDSNSLRITNQSATGSLVAVTINSGTDPSDTDGDSDDDNSHMISPQGFSSVFVESAPSGPWDVRYRLITGSEACLELEEF